VGSVMIQRFPLLVMTASAHLLIAVRVALP
jgi:hypothetical protein